MGNAMSKGQLVISLEALLKEFGVPLSRKILKRFVETLSITSKWFLEQDQVDSAKWNKVKGDIVLPQQLYGLESLPGPTLMVWGVVGDALNACGTAAAQLATEAVRTARQTEEEDRSSIMSSTSIPRGGQLLIGTGLQTLGRSRCCKRHGRTRLIMSGNHPHQY
ncbi:uncharacterized protein LOC129145310 isoform X2 [Talpa occidentalis]|uniref:uncharacterized protein LOC129145310 isoform X2 n=1 Tax=Talpa occidentalis TaxID=50954 RepID=UPI0023F8AB0C|nr:uncharacterized protein LOC129145310 isoform X2 [Talpa occidentalis]